MKRFLFEKAGLIRFHDVPRLGTLNLYRMVLRFAAVQYFSCAVVFFFSGQMILLAIAMAASITNICLALKRSENFQFLVLFEHILIIVVTVLFVVFGSWDYGFQYLLILAIVMTIFSPFKSTAVVTILGFSEAIIYLLLYSFCAGDTSGDLLPKVAIQLIHCYIFFSVATITIISIRSADFTISTHGQRIIEKNRELDDLAHRDELTGLINRRAMREILDDAWDDYATSGAEFSVIAADIDNLKTINDTFGHDFGDQLIKTVSKILETEFRKHDFVSRWGGDEFLILISEGGSYDDLVDLVERVRKRISDGVYSHNGEAFTTSVTFGGASCVGKSDLLALVSEADAQLYIGKQAGRDVVRIEEQQREPR